MKRILVTGASGYVGTLLVERLLARGFSVTAALRSSDRLPNVDGLRRVVVGSVDRKTDWDATLNGCDAVVHLAAQVPEKGVGKEEFDTVNIGGTARLVDQAKQSSVGLFVFVSSVFATSGHSAKGALDDAMQAAPTTLYGHSKLAAEAYLAGFEGNGRVGITLRPPLVYGAGAKGNWHLLQKVAASPLPLPFAGVKNRRTLIGRENFVNAISHLIGLPAERRVAGTYLVGDSETVSISEILTWLREGMGRSPRLFPVSSIALRSALAVLGRGRIAESLLGDLELDSSRFRETFGWSPPVDTREGIIRAGADFVR